MNIQDAFNTCYTRIIQQGCASGVAYDDYDDFQCQYRDNQGHGCAVGVMLSDDSIAKIIDHESNGASIQGIWFIVQSELAIEGFDECQTQRFWVKMQAAHDDAATGRGDFISHFKAYAKDVAGLYYLTVPEA